MQFGIDKLLKLAHSPIQNYVVPGVTSYLITTPHEVESWMYKS
jgi:hypothetical protein